MSTPMFSNPFEHSHPCGSLGLDPIDLLSSLIAEFQHLGRFPEGHPRPQHSQASRKDSGSTVCCNQNRFQANLDVQQFRPEEITVKVNQNIITVEGNHEEKEDEHGSISRHFVRKYVVPEGHNLDQVESKMSSDGMLIITAPKIGDEEEQCKSIPVIQTGQPSKAVEKKEETEEEK